MSVSDEQYERVCNFTDELITEKHDFMNRALKAEIKLVIWRSFALSGWTGLIVLAVLKGVSA